MHVLDIALLGVIGIAAVIGAFKGLVRQLGVAVAVVAGITMALKHGTIVAAWLSTWIGSSQLRAILGPGLTFLGVYLAVALVAALLHHLMATSPLGWMNRLLGSLVGVASATLLCGAILFVAVARIGAARPVIARSPVALEVMRGSCALVRLVPPELRRAFNHGFSEVKALLDARRHTPALPPPRSGSA